MEGIDELREGYAQYSLEMVQIGKRPMPFEGYAQYSLEMVQIGKRPMSFEAWAEERLADEAYGSYMEERENNEYERMMQIPDKDLPLHMNEPWEFDTVTQEFWKRLKGVQYATGNDPDR